ncbi:MAG TPA: hypothetical protein VGB66_11105 [Longimicrobium sp.]
MAKSYAYRYGLALRCDPAEQFPWLTGYARPGGYGSTYGDLACPGYVLQSAAAGARWGLARMQPAISASAAEQRRAARTGQRSWS